MNAEITKIKEIIGLEGWVLFDGECPACCDLAARFENVLTRRGFDPAPFQSPWVQECLGVETTKPAAGLRVLTVGGDDLAGADALIYLARRIWWARPVGLLAKFPPGWRLLRLAHDRYLARSLPPVGTGPAIPEALRHGQ